jgi:hypothetical protein
MTITADKNAAIRQFAQNFAESFAQGLAELTAALESKPEVPAAKPAKKRNGASRKKKYAPIDSFTPASVREERQRMILTELAAAGGEVTRQEWIDIAARFGYEPRRLGGFFTKNGGVGMLAMSPDRKTVQLTEHGKARL